MKKIIVFLLLDFSFYGMNAQNELFTLQTVKTDLVGICAIDYADFDQDGDIDIGWGSEWTPTANPTGVHWLENTGDDFNQWQSHSIDPSMTGVMSLQVIDLNNDQLPDMLCSAWGTHDIVWYENPGGDMTNWTKHTLISSFYNAHDAYADYINDDDLIDIVAVAAYQGQIRILYNIGSASSPSFDSYTLCSDYIGVRTAISHDFDNDGDKDILAASTDSDVFYWWRNNGSEQDWTQFLIDDQNTGFHNFSLKDIDYDGDMDFIGIGGDMLTLYRNEGGDPIAWVKETLADDLGISSRNLAHDYDLDGDIDDFVVSKIPGRLDYYQNNGGIPINWQDDLIQSNFNGAWGCQAIDFDGDDDIDIFACAGADNTIVYLENQTFADSTHIPKALFLQSRNQVCQGSEVQFINLSAGSIDNYTWDFGVDATPAIATGEGPHTVSYSSVGEKYISLTVDGTYGSSTFTDTIIVSNELNFNFIPNELLIECRGDSIQLAVYGADEYLWSPEPTIQNSISSVALINDIETTAYTVTGIMGSCTTDTTIVINVEKKENDDVCDAILLDLGYNGTFSNECTLPEEGEPVPPLTGCETQLSWCDDGGIQNSIWFKFEAPASGAVEISTFGTDNQIAVYDAESCEAILSGDYALLAANDNNGGTFAKIDSLASLIPGKLYWIQLDGNAGASGSNSITISELVNIEKTMPSMDFKIYPNPSQGTIYIQSESNQTINMQIFSIHGKQIIKNSIETNQAVQLDDLHKGLYFIKFVNKNNKEYIKKIIIE